MTPTPQEAREAHKLLAAIDPKHLPNGALNTFDAYITASEARIKDLVNMNHRTFSDSARINVENDTLRAQLAARDALLAEAGEALQDAITDLEMFHGARWSEYEGSLETLTGKAASVAQKIREVK